MTDLKPCPFCGAALDYAAPVSYVHPVGKCILSGRNFHKGNIGQWNTRADLCDPAAIREAALREAAAAVQLGATVAQIQRAILALIDRGG